MNIAGTVALVTGAGSGIGRATAERLATEGASVVVADRAADGGAETVARIEAAGGRAAFARTDVAVDEDVRAAVATAEERFGGLDVLVNNAGIATTPAFPAAPLERWLRVLDVNLRGVMLTTQHALAAMAQRGGGAIVNIASLAGVGLEPHDAPDYAASKAGVVRLTAALAGLRETAGVRVNCICPDWVDTPMSRRTRARMSAEELASVPPVLLTPEQIADAVVQFVVDDSLAGRVMVWWCGQDRRLLDIRSE